MYLVISIFKGEPPTISTDTADYQDIFELAPDSGLLIFPEELTEDMKDIEFSAPEITIYSDYTAQPYEGDYKALVKAQVENPVKWQTIVENMIADGVDTFIEVGVGKTLTGLVKRINADVKAFKVETPSDIDALEI